MHTSRTRTTLVGLVGGLALTLGLVAGPLQATASAAPANQCPAAYPHADLVSGQTVNGLTTTLGTTPEAFTGTYVSTIDDGISPGRDLLIFQLKGSRITKPNGDVDAGIWAGISGSPLYDDATGKLIGSVSYGFSLESSDFAGVTPAEYLYELRSPNVGAASQRSVVKLSSRERRELTTAGLAPQAARGGLAPLEIPRSVSGISVSRATAIAKRTGLADAHFVSGTGAAASANPANYPLVAGGSVAGSNASGAIGLAGVGSITAVCGTKVIAYGHPSQFTGTSHEALHGASAALIQRDNTFGSYKIANIGPVVGAITQDRLQGILGAVGSFHPSTHVGSTTILNGTSRTSSSNVTEPTSLAFVAAVQAASDTTVALNRAGGGDAELAWKILIKRADGSITTFRRSDRYTSRQGISDEAPGGLAADLMRIVDQDLENVTVTRVGFTNKLSGAYREYKIAKVRVRHKGTWRRVSAGQTLKVSAGHKLRVRLYLSRANAKSTVTPVTRDLVYTIPKKAAGKKGLISINAGAVESTGDEEYDELFGPDTSDEPQPETFDELLESLKGSLRQDEIAADAFVGSLASSRVLRVPGVTTGSFELPLSVAKKKQKK